MKPLWLTALLPLCACGSAQPELQARSTELTMISAIRCFDDLVFTNAADIAIQADGSIEISEAGNSQTVRISRDQMGRHLYDLGFDGRQPVYVQADVSTPYLDVMDVLKDLKMRGYAHIRLVNTPV